MHTSSLELVQYGITLIQYLPLLSVHPLMPLTETAQMRKGYPRIMPVWIAVDFFMPWQTSFPPPPPVAGMPLRISYGLVAGSRTPALKMLLVNKPVIVQVFPLGTMNGV